MDQREKNNIKMGEALATAFTEKGTKNYGGERHWQLLEPIIW
jgi:hypothetical protein